MAYDAEQLLVQALQGREVEERAAEWDGLPEQPWRFWQANENVWAVFLLLGSRLSKGMAESVQRSQQLGLRPVVILMGNDEIGAMAPYFRLLGAHVICNVAGKGEMIEPVSVSETETPEQSGNRTRMPVDVLDELAGDAKLPQVLRRPLRKLLSSYRGTDLPDDVKEDELLLSFAGSVMRSMGFSAEHAKVVRMLRSFEVFSCGTNPSLKARDHYFHSFQNFFYGLVVLCGIEAAFDGCFQVTRLGWDVKPYQIWFLTSLWHDVGYCIQNFSEHAAAVYDGRIDADEVAMLAATRYLNTEETEIALREIASLIARLLDYENATTTWTPPRATTRPSTAERAVSGTLRANFAEGHGTASSLKLYNNLMPAVDRKADPSKRDELRQVVYAACCAIPFHDHKFRRLLRQEYGDFRIPTVTMPFAALLAFVDSIQDDRRDLSGLEKRTDFLVKLIVERCTVVSAEVNMAALEDTDVLWKIVEARDVMGTIYSNADEPTFMYPNWMAG